MISRTSLPGNQSKLISVQPITSSASNPYFLETSAQQKTRYPSKSKTQRGPGVYQSFHKRMSVQTTVVQQLDLSPYASKFKSREKQRSSMASSRSREGLPETGKPDYQLIAKSFITKTFGAQEYYKSRISQERMNSMSSILYTSSSPGNTLVPKMSVAGGKSSISESLPLKGPKQDHGSTITKTLSSRRKEILQNKSNQQTPYETRIQGSSVIAAANLHSPMKVTLSKISKDMNDSKTHTTNKENPSALSASKV